jgi:hypothetical protein
MVNTLGCYYKRRFDPELVFYLSKQKGDLNFDQKILIIFLGN